MQKSLTKTLFRHSFWIVLLLHILFLLCITTEFVFAPDDEKEKDQKVPHRVPRQEAQHYVPSYVYSGSIKPTFAQQTPHEPTPETKQVTKQVEKTPPIEKAPSNEKMLAESHRGIKKSHPIRQPSILDMSRAAIQNNFASAALNNSQAEEPILLVGDESSMVDPLVKLLGRSLSANFRYPHVEGAFGATGRVYVRMVLHPEGYYTNVQIVQASENDDFNRAALYAVNEAPRVIGANKFLKEPKQFLVGFIFN